MAPLALSLFAALVPFVWSGDKNLHDVVKLRELIAAIDVPLDEVVDFPVAEFDRVFHEGNLCPFRRAVAQKMIEQKPIHITLVGGSVTYGADLANREQERWSNRFTKIMQSGWYKGSEIVVSNIGVGACNIDTWIYRVNELSSTDLIIVDLSVNDQGFDLQSLPYYYQTFIQLVDELPNHPAIFFHYAFRTGKYERVEYAAHCPAEQDQGMCCNGYMWCRRWWEMQDYVAITLDRLGVPYISYRDLVWPKYDEPPEQLPQFWNGLSHPDYKTHALFAKLIAYGIYRQIKDVHHFNTDAALLRLGIKENAAASEASAGLTAGLAGVTDTRDRRCDVGATGSSRYVSEENKDATVVQLCENPSAMMRATDNPQSFQSFKLSEEGNVGLVAGLSSPAATTSSDGSDSSSSRSMGNMWRFYSDSKNKHGWIAEVSKADKSSVCGGEGVVPWCAELTPLTTLSLEVEVGSSGDFEEPILQIFYLKSYDERMGKVRVWLDEDYAGGVIIDARWEPEYSVTAVATISQHPLEGVSETVKGKAYVMPGLTRGEHTLRFSVYDFPQEKFKWKLIGVTSC